MESSATHYEREYGPGVHAAGLAVYTGSLYLSSRSSFRPLMRVSSGVRNLIDGGDGGGAAHGAGGAPGASPPPVPAQTVAAEESASATLAAHLHTTVDRRLDVHAASEDTVLLAGHMRELWDGGAAIVAAMTDDTVAWGLTFG